MILNDKLQTLYDGVQMKSFMDQQKPISLMFLNEKLQTLQDGVQTKSFMVTVKTFKKSTTESCSPFAVG